MKLILRKLPVLLIYIVIFVAVLLLAAFNFTESDINQTTFTPSRSDIAVIQEESSPLVEGLLSELRAASDFVNLSDEQDAIQEALFFRSVSYVLRIPKGFTSSFFTGGSIDLEKTVVPDSVTNIYLDMLINRYLNTARIYHELMPDISQEQLVLNISNDLAQNAPVDMLSTPGTASVQSYSAFFFNYIAFIYLSVLILGISALMVIFNKVNLKKRNACSPIPSASINRQFILANLVLTFSVWVILSSLFFILNPSGYVPASIGYFLLNSFSFALCAASISYLIGISVKNSSAVSAVSNVVALGSSFLSGVFVPQQLLAEPVLRIASIMPTYWYVRANNQISSIRLFDYRGVMTFLPEILIVLGFAFGFMVLSFVIGRRVNLKVS